jgi:type I restriction enzyme S subunit
MALCDRLALQQQERETRHAALARASLARFADEPTPANLTFLFHPSYAISPADLRKSILTLAVQGKLVRFEAENDAQTVGDHIEFQNGYAFKSQWFKPDGMRLCRNVNVSHGVVDWRESAFVDDDIAKEFERFALSEGDIVLSLDRPLITTGLKVARIRKSDLPCLLLQRVAKPVPKHDQLDMYYFLLWLNSSEFVDSIDPGRSNGVPHISTRQVQLLPFVLPPLAEQRRIVAKVEQLMALVDALETQLATSCATAENLLAAVVAELTEGTHASPAC